MRPAVLVIVSVAFLLAATALGICLRLRATPPSPRERVLARGLERPVGLAVAPGGAIYVIEQYRGTVRVIRDGRLLERPFARIEGGVYRGHNETGLIGICLDPSFEENGFVYAFATVSDSVQRVYRWRAGEGDRGVEATVLIDDLPTVGANHDGGGIGFGPDGMLYVSVGDNGRRRQEAPDPASLRGKILRYTPDGGVPEDNPFGRSNPVWAIGLRNSYRFCFMPDGRLYATENGPDRNDEVNLIERGQNYGWPGHTGESGSPDFRDPVWVDRAPPSLTGIAPCSGAAYAEWESDLLVGSWNDGRIRRFHAPEDGSTLRFAETVVDRGFGVTDLVAGPDGVIHYTLFAGEVVRIEPAY